MSENIVGSGGLIATESGVTTGKTSGLGSLINFAMGKIIGTAKTTSSVQTFSATIEGKTLAKYQRGYMLNLPGTGPWDIKITRTTADSTTANIANELWWADYVEIVNAKLNYPNSAMIYTAIDAEQFSSIPSRSFEIYGIKCKVPSNYNQATRTYTGFWDGTFVTAWTDNPAWVFYDLVTSTRYGLGDVVQASLVDKWTLYSIAQYCDGLVPDGKGAFEPRFTCNLYLQTREDAYKVVANLASIFRGMVFWATGLVTASQDAPKAIDAIYTAANVIDGRFTYTGTSAKARHNVVLVSWNNPANGYALEIEYIEDAESIIKNGIIQTEISAMGCTSQGQAHRLGKWLLYTEQHETETVEFKTGLDGIICQPGDVIQTQDPFRAGKRLGGRVVSIATTPGVSAVVTIDSPILFQVGKTYTALLTSSAGTIVSFPLSNTLNNTNQSTLNITTTQTIDIQVGSVWVVAVSDLSLQSWRVISVAEATDGSIDVAALMYNPDKYAAIEYNLSLKPRVISTIALTPPNVTEVKILEHMYLLGANRLSNKLSISWVEEGSIDTYIVNYSKTSDNTNPKYITVNLPTVEIEDVSEGEYTIGIVSVNALGIKSANVSTVYTVVGKTASPADISNFTSSLTNDIITLSWTDLPDLDLDYYEIRYGASWGIDNTTSTYVYRGRIPSVSLPKIYASGITHKFYVKAVDTSGNWSASYTLSGTLIDNITAKIISNTLPTPSILPVLSTAYLANTTMTIVSPNNVTALATTIDTNILHISWTAATKPTNGLSIQKYIVYINGNKFTETTGTTVDYNWVDTELTKIVKITTVDLLGYESLGTSITKTVVVPNIVTGLTSTLVGTKVNLAWTAATVNGSNIATKAYRIYVDTLVVAEVTALNYSYTWTDSSMSKVFYVETVDYINNPSATKPSTTMGILVPSPVTSLTSTMSGVTLTTTWTHSTVTGNRFPIAKYNIYFGPVGNYAKIDEVVANTYIQEWLYANSTKVILVEAVDALGHVSSLVSYTTTIVAPNAPSSLSTVLKATKALFTWSPATTAVNSLPIQYYELREGGTTWADATFIANIPASSSVLQFLYGITNTTELSNPNVGTMQYGTAKIFRIASKDIGGIYSSTTATYSLTITKPTALSDLSLNIVGPYINAAWSPIIQGTGLNAFTLPIDRYEIRTTRSSSTSEGTWNSATSLSSLSGSAIALDPPTNPSIDPSNNATGDWFYLIRAYDIFNVGGTIYNKSLTIVAPSIPVSLSSKVIDNNILMLWGQPVSHSFPISTFMLKKSLDPAATYLTADTIGTKSGGFTNVFEESSGLYHYILAGIDTAGNIGTMSKVTAQVNQPPDFVLTNDLFRDDFALTIYGSNAVTSTRNNIVISDRLGLGVGTNSLLGPVSATQTFETHFSGNTWTTPQAQVTAGYPVYAQPAVTSGTLEDIIDYNTIITSNQYVSISLDVSNMVGTTGTYQVSIGTSADNVTYTTTSSVVQSATVPNISFGVFAIGFRYVKVIVTLISNTAGIDLIRINNYRVKLSLKYTNDGSSGSVSNNGIYSINLAGAGSGYTTAPSVSISGGGGSGALAYTTISGGIITGIVITNSGNGYTGTPTVTITGGGGSGYAIGTITKTTATSGSFVSFNYAYIDVSGIQVTYGGTTSGLAIYDFVDIAYPKFFRVLLFDTTGTPILGNFSWSAKGTI